MRSYNRETTVSLRCPEPSLLSEHNKMSLKHSGAKILSVAKLARMKYFSGKDGISVHDQVLVIMVLSEITIGFMANAISAPISCDIINRLIFRSCSFIFNLVEHPSKNIIAGNFIAVTEFRAKLQEGYRYASFTGSFGLFKVAIIVWLLSSGITWLLGGLALRGSHFLSHLS